MRLNPRRTCLTVAFLVTAISDAVRDSFIYRSGIGWWDWHIVKWIAVYLIPITLLFVITREYRRWKYWAAVAIACSLLWNLVYYILTGSLSWNL